MFAISFTTREWLRLWFSTRGGFKAVTLYPAQILNVADRLGSIEVGKMANLVSPTEICWRRELTFVISLLTGDPCL